MPVHTMNDVLKNEAIFREKFCAEATLGNLGEVPVEALRKTVQMIHNCSGFRAAGTPRKWSRVEQPVIVFGQPAVDGAMEEPKFGLTTNVLASGQPKGTKLFLWVSKRAFSAVQSSNSDSNLQFMSSWLPWRVGGENTYSVLPVPLCKQDRPLDDAEIRVSFSETVLLGSFLTLLGPQLHLRPEVEEAFSGITKGLGLETDCITPRAVEIMKDGLK